MDLGLTQEQRELQATLRRALSEQLPPSRLRAALAGDEDVWSLTAEQLGVHGLAVPEAAGGSGAGEVEQVLLLEEAGRALVPDGFFSTVALAGTLLRCADDRTLLPALAEGSLRASFAWAASDRVLVPAVDGTDLVSGVAVGVLDAARADVLLVIGAGGRLLAVQRDQPGVAVEPLTTLDLTRPAATVRFDRARATLVADSVGDALGLMRLGLAAEQVGGAARCLELSVQHAIVREQFGRPIGSFQAVKHKLADMRVRVDLATALCWYAAGHPDEPQWALAAGSACAEAYLRVASDAIQVHGGIGFTWEHELHLHYRRARADHAMLGSPRVLRAELAALLQGSAA
jgi:acyl-CoA dehydrogenase